MKNILIMIVFVMINTTAFAQKAKSNTHFWNTEETTATPATIWKIWTDVSNWKTWDKGLKDAFVSAPFVLGTKGKIITLEGRKSKFKVVQYDQGISYTFKTKLPLGALYVKRFLEQRGTKTVFTHEVWFKGLTASIFAKNFGPQFRKILPEVMLTIKEIAEK